MAPQQLTQARLVDTLVGCMLGLAAAACMHSLRFRAVVGAGLRRLWPEAKSSAPCRRRLRAGELTVIG